MFFQIADILFPRLCFSCEARLSSTEKIICKPCLSKIKEADDERVKREYLKDFSTEKFVSDFTALFIFQKEKELQSVIHAMKYKKRFVIGTYFGSLLAERLKGKIMEWEIEKIIPVPLHHKRFSERSYNHSFFIAKEFSERINIPIDSKSLKRIRYTASQTKMTLEERKENIEGAFAVSKKADVKGKRILLLDDVITTGSTIQECAKTLINAGANKVYAASVAIAD